VFGNETVVIAKHARYRSRYCSLVQQRIHNLESRIYWVNFAPR
jgi:hypothetical protein